MKKNLLLLLLLICISHLIIHTKNDLTFNVTPKDLRFAKTFINKTKKTFVIKWSLQNPDDRSVFFKQEPLIKPGQKLDINFSKGLLYIKKELEKQPLELEFSLQIVTLPEQPKKPGYFLTYKELKDNLKALTKNNFLYSSHFEFFEEKPRLISMKVF